MHTFCHVEQMYIIRQVLWGLGYPCTIQVERNFLKGPWNLNKQRSVFYLLSYLKSYRQWKITTKVVTQTSMQLTAYYMTRPVKTARAYGFAYFFKSFWTHYFLSQHVMAINFSAVSTHLLGIMMQLQNENFLLQYWDMISRETGYSLCPRSLFSQA